MIKLIASDLDGTLIPEGEFGLSEQFFDVLGKLLDQGYEFYAASGRPYVSEKEVFGSFRNKIGYISDNGSLVVEDEEDVYINEFPKDIARAITEEFRDDSKGISIIAGTRYGYMTTQNQDFIDYVVNDIKVLVKQIDSYDDIPENPIKVSINVPDADLLIPVQQELQAKYGEKVDFVTSGNGWIDGIYKKSGKGIALLEIMKKKGLKPEEVMVFGDNENDISLFRVTPNSYCLAHSKEHVKAQAQYETADLAATLRKLVV